MFQAPVSYSNILYIRQLSATAVALFVHTEKKQYLHGLQYVTKTQSI